MARVKIEMPPAYQFQTELSVRISELNYGNHLGNDRVLTLMHEARMRFFRHFGYTELDAEGISFLQGDCAIVYRSQAFWGDQLIVKVATADFTRAAFDFYFQFVNKSTGKVVADGKTGLVCYDFESEKVVSVPPALKAKFGDAFQMEKEQKAV